MKTKRKKLPTTFVVKRRKWLRGEGSSNSRLLRPLDMKMCCIGFCMQQLGIAPKQLNDLGGVLSLEMHRVSIPDSAFCGDPDWLNEAYVTNDTEEIDDFYREMQLKEIFKRANRRIRFVD